MMCVLISLLHQISTILSVTKTWTPYPDSTDTYHTHWHTLVAASTVFAYHSWWWTRTVSETYRTKINKVKQAASRWWFIYKILRMHGTMNIKKKVLRSFTIFRGATAQLRHKPSKSIGHILVYPVGLLCTIAKLVAEKKYLRSTYNIQQKNVHALSGSRTRDPRNRVEVDLRHRRIDQRNRAYNLHKHNIWLYSSQTPKVGLKLKSLHLRWTLICVFGTRSLMPHTGRHTNAHDILQNVIGYCCAINI